MRQRILFLVGPTAIGKSAVAIELASRLNGRILSCDSMQVYKKMDIITSKPKASVRKKIKHYLINTVAPTEEYNVYRYRREAFKKIKYLEKSVKLPIFVGGTGLYVSALIDGIFEAGFPKKEARELLYKEASRRGSRHLYRRLKKIDPRAALKIHPNDTKRIVRALEIFKLTGKPISLLQKQRSGLSGDYDIRIFCLNMPRDKLYQRIDRRVDSMFKQGLLKEAGALLKLKLSRTAAYAIGLRELKGYFSAEYGLGQAKELIKRNTRRYAKRQLTWFRKDKRIIWVDIKENEKPKAIAGRIISLWKERF